MLVSKTYVCYKIAKGLSPRYLTKYVNLRSTFNCHSKSANKNNLQEFSCSSESFKYSFIPFRVREWNKLDNTIQVVEFIKQFKSTRKNFFLWTKDLYFRYMTQWVLYCLQDYGYNSVTLMNISFVIISKTAWVPCVIMVLKQKQPATLSCVANFLQKKGKSSVIMFMLFSYMSAKALSAMQPFILLILISSQILAFSKGCIRDISYYVQHFTIRVFVCGKCWVMS